MTKFRLRCMIFLHCSYVTVNTTFPPLSHIHFITAIHPADSFLVSPVTINQTFVSGIDQMHK